MEKSKYYTPEIEEFCEGFEYEIFEDFDFYLHKSWHKFVFTYEDVEKMNFPLPVTSKIRVKYLDEQDILDLGWTKTEEKCPHTDKNYFVINEDYGFDIGTIHKIILYQNGNLHYMWEYSSSYNTSKGQMIINIKNKTELKKLMRYLNINHGIQNGMG